MFCNVCGNNVKDGAAFCEVCGSPIGQKNGQQPNQTQQPGGRQIPYQNQQQQFQQNVPYNQQPQLQQGMQPQFQQNIPPDYQQNMPPNYQQSVPPQSGAKSNPLPIIIAAIAVVVVLGVLCILLFVSPGFLRKDDDWETVSNTTNESKTEVTTETVTEATTEVVTEETTTEATTAEVTTETTTEATTEDVRAALFAEAAKLSTSDRPNIAQFFWYTEGVRWDGIPAGVETITQRELLEGDWMMYMVTDPYYKTNSYSERYLNANIHLEDDGKSVSINLDWWMMNYGGESVDESVYGDEKFTGSYDESNCMVTQSSAYNSLTLTDYWKRGKNQFILGTFMWNDGSEGLVALVRPGENIEYEQSDNIVDYSKSSNAISDEELLRRAREFTGAPYAEIDSIDSATGCYYIHCYDIIDDGGGNFHTSTYNWLTIDPVTLLGNDISGDPVNLN